MRVAIIDIGSNSIKLLVVEKSNTCMRVVTESSEDTRISSKKSVEKGILEERRMLSAVESVRHLLTEAKLHKPDKILITATSAVRDASNKEEFQHHIESATGHPLVILSGEEEAKGIAQGILTDPKLTHASDFCLFDLGGGSLELISYSQGKVSQAISLPLGAVRMHQKFAGDHTGPWSKDRQQKLENHILDAIATSDFDWPKRVPLVATGGSVNMACAILGNQSSESQTKLSFKDISTLQQNICNMTLDERLQVQGLPTKRADIAPAALVIIKTLMEIGQHETVQQSFHNLRYGLARRVLDGA